VLSLSGLLLAGMGASTSGKSRPPRGAPAGSLCEFIQVARASLDALRTSGLIHIPSFVPPSRVTDSREARKLLDLVGSLHQLEGQAFLVNRS